MSEQLRRDGLGTTEPGTLAMSEQLRRDELGTTEPGTLAMSEQLRRDGLINRAFYHLFFSIGSGYRTTNGFKPGFEPDFEPDFGPKSFFIHFRV
jgi:hypothetical protein